MVNGIWKSLDATLGDVLDMTWPMILISVVLLSSIRLTTVLKNKEQFILHKELLSLFFVVYILCMFQVVTFQDVSTVSANNFVPFREITRYAFGSRLFIKNIIGNMIMFVPYGFFSSYFSKNNRIKTALLLVLTASVVIESTQLAIGRIFDVDDILLNVAGGMIGYFIYLVFDKLGRLCPKVFKSNLFLDIMSALVFLTFAFYIIRR